MLCAVAGTTLRIYNTVIVARMRGQAASHAVGTRTTAEHEPAYLMRSICDANPKTKCRTIKTECVFICVETKCQRSGEQRRRAWDIGKRTG